MKSMKAKPKKRTNVKVKFSGKEVPAEPDLSQLHCPVDTSLSTLHRVCKLLESGSEEVRSLLAHECDLVYECRVCRSLFRSLVNFISHKRVYCRKKFDVSYIRNMNHETMDVLESSTKKSEKLCETGNDRILRSQVSREEKKVDICNVVDMLQKKQSLQAKSTQLFLQDMESNHSAVYQTITNDETNLMKSQVSELENLLTRQTAVLGPDGSFFTSNQGEITEGETDKNINCSICNMKFSTKKTLSTHTRTEHGIQRLFTCPCCTNTFTNTWSVYRHLFRVHRKSNEQVRKLRSQIQEKACSKETLTIEESDKERKINKVTLKSREPVNERQDKASQESQKLCTLKPECSESLQILSPPPPGTSIGVEADRQDKTSQESEKLCSLKPGCSESLQTLSPPIPETSIRVEAVSSLSKAAWELLESADQHHKEAQKHEEQNDVSEDMEIVTVYANIAREASGSRRRKCGAARRVLHTELETLKPVESRMDKVLLMERRMSTVANMQTLECLLCRRKFTSATNLRRHAALHIGWSRFCCRLCGFSCFIKCDCVAHCNRLHQAQNNRSVISEMISEIPEEEYDCDKEIVFNVSALENCDVEVTAPEKEKVKEKDPNLEEGTTKSSELDPDLRRMVMEVIFGSLDTTVESEPKEGASEECCKQSKDAKEDSKPQRPIRNRIKPLNKDFIYDLKEVAFRKDSIILKPFSRPLKKSLMQDENAEGSKRFKGFECENGVEGFDVKNGFAFSQCRS